MIGCIISGVVLYMILFKLSIHIKIVAIYSIFIMKSIEILKLDFHIYDMIFFNLSMSGYIYIKISIAK